MHELSDFTSKLLDARKLVIAGIRGAKRGHLGPALSVLDILLFLYEHTINHDATNPTLPNRDRIILSKGHGCLALYAVLAQQGYFPLEELDNFCKFDGILGGHPESTFIPGVEFSTGSLGHGMAVGVGFAMASRLKNLNFKTYVIVGDGETQEGSIWESAMHAASHSLGLLTVIVDQNHMQANGKRDEVVLMHSMKDKWAAFGFDVFEINGHDFDELKMVLNSETFDNHKPRVIIANTVKGKGFKDSENSTKWHHLAKISDLDLENLLLGELQ